MSEEPKKAEFAPSESSLLGEGSSFGVLSLPLNLQWSGVARVGPKWTLSDQNGPFGSREC